MVAVGSQFPHHIIEVGLKEKNKLAEKNNEETKSPVGTEVSVSGSKVAYIQVCFEVHL